MPRDVADPVNTPSTEAGRQLRELYPVLPMTPAGVRLAEEWMSGPLLNEPAEVVALYEDKADAEAEAARRNEAANTGMWEVGSFTLNRRAAPPLPEPEPDA